MTASSLITLPPVTCSPWCQDGAGHVVDVWNPADQYCLSEREEVELTAMPLLTSEGKLVHDDHPVASLTPSEAVELGRLLVRLGETADQ